MRLLSFAAVSMIITGAANNISVADPAAVAQSLTPAAAYMEHVAATEQSLEMRSGHRDVRLISWENNSGASLSGPFQFTPAGEFPKS